MNNDEEIEKFLEEFKLKLGIWKCLYRDDRGKNTQTLLELEIRPMDREKYLKELKLEDYCQGPVLEGLYGGSDMWIFGKTVKGKEIYIKITLGRPSDKVICISFHVAEHPMNYPYKR